MKTARILTVAAVAVMTAATCGWAVEPGDEAPEFSLKGVDGKTHNLSDYEGKIVVLEWTNYDCPFVKKHYESGNMQKLQRDYTGKDVAWLAINSSAPGKQGNFSVKTWKERAKKQKQAATAILLDPDGKVGKAYGAKTTPHLFVVGKDGKVAYAGAIDDQPSWKSETVKKAENYVAKALDALLAGKEVETKVSRPYGCSVKY